MCSTHLRAKLSYFQRFFLRAFFSDCAAIFHCIYFHIISFSFLSWMCAAVCSVHCAPLHFIWQKFQIHIISFIIYAISMQCSFASRSLQIRFIENEKLYIQLGSPFKTVIIIHVVIVVIIITQTLFIVIWHIVLLSTHKIAWKPQNIYKKKSSFHQESERIFFI